MQESEEIGALVKTLAQGAREASFALATLETGTKNAVLGRLAALLEEHGEALITENAKDLEAGRALEIAAPLLERLTLTPERIAKMAEGVRQVAALPDPVGEEIERLRPSNGLDIRKIRVPIGVVGIIYESRPNVTIDCAALCLKSGNAAILRGGKEAFHTNSALAGLIDRALREEGVAENAVQLVPTTDRWALNELLRLDEYVHAIIPRGGDSLIRFVVENSRIPVIKHYLGVCSMFIDAEADPEKALALAVNAKVQRVSVCNAIENLFIHKDIAEDFLAKVCRALAEHDIELRVDDACSKIIERVNRGGLLLGTTSIDYNFAAEKDFYTEYLDKIISIKLVEDIDDAIATVNRYGSGHSDAIVTENQESAEKFLRGVDSATIYWNASTRFTDGFEFGLGAEIGISTDRLHARGPMGLRELCTYKLCVYGTGQVRE